MSFRKVNEPNPALVRLIDSSEEMSGLQAKVAKNYSLMALGARQELLTHYVFESHGKVIGDVTLRSELPHREDILPERVYLGCSESPVGICVYERNKSYGQFARSFNRCLCCNKSYIDRNKLNKRIKDETG